MQTEKHERLAAENARIAKKQHREELRKIAALAQAQAKAEQAKAKAEAEARQRQQQNGMYELDQHINYLQNMHPYDATQKLYRKRLLTLLPHIRSASHVDITLPETKGNTASHYACGMGNVELVRWLVTQGANIYARTNKGKTPWDCAGGNVQAVRRALNTGY